TAGMRVFRAPRPGAWLYEVEAIVQRGRSVGTVAGVARGGLRHRASLLHAELGYAFAMARPAALRVTYDRATGDRDPLDQVNERFDTLAGARRFDFGPTGIYGPFARANIESAGVRLTLDAAARARTMIDYRTFRLASASDAWSTTGLRDASGRSGQSLGRQLEASVT